MPRNDCRVGGLSAQELEQILARGFFAHSLDSLLIYALKLRGLVLQCYWFYQTWNTPSARAPTNRGMTWSPRNTLIPRIFSGVHLMVDPFCNHFHVTSFACRGDSSSHWTLHIDGQLMSVNSDFDIPLKSALKFVSLSSLTRHHLGSK